MLVLFSQFISINLVKHTFGGLSVNLIPIWVLLTIIIRYTIFFLLFVKTPLLACFLLVLIRLNIRLFIFFLSSKWLSFLIVLLFLGGIMVLFVYICTLISRMKIAITDSYKKFIIFILLRTVPSMVFYNKKVGEVGELKEVILSCIFQKSLCSLLARCTLYLLLVLLICVKLVQKHKGGLKSKIYDF